MDVHTICLIGETMLYCVLIFYLFWNTFFFSSSRWINRSCSLFLLCHPSRSSRGGVSEFTTNIPQKEESTRERLDAALKKNFCLVFPIICLWDVLLWWDMCLDPDAGRKLTTTTILLAPWRIKCWTSLDIVHGRGNMVHVQPFLCVSYCLVFC